ncbi:24000_t:CDS:2, partial [Gigaspora rosea]
FSFGTYPYNSSSPSTSEEELPLPKPSYYDEINNHEHTLNSINQRIAESSGIFSINEINKAEKSFLKILGRFQVSDENVRDFIE